MKPADIKVNDILVHRKLGRGLVEEVTEKGTIVVIFQRFDANGEPVRGYFGPAWFSIFPYDFTSEAAADKREDLPAGEAVS